MLLHLTPIVCSCQAYANRARAGVLQERIGGRLAMMAKLKCGSRMFAGPADCCSSFQFRDDFLVFEFADNALVV